MNTLNENGPKPAAIYSSVRDRNRRGEAADLATGQAVTIVPEGTQGFVSGDASRWTPFGTYLTAEESWGGGTKGRLFEVTNPLAAPAR